MESIRRRFDEVKDISPILEEIRSERLVDGARSCAIIGCGYGELELAFIEQCMPELETLTAVEPEAESVVELKARIARQLPNVRSTVFEQAVESWAVSCDQVFDVVVMFHCVTEIPEPERRPLFSRLLESLMKPGSLLLVVTRNGRLDGSQTTDSRIAEALTGRPYDDSKWYDDTRQLLQSIGFTVGYERRYVLHLNVENLDDAFFALQAHFCDEPTTLEHVEQVVRSVIGDDKWNRREMFFGLFRKPVV